MQRSDGVAYSFSDLQQSPGSEWLKRFHRGPNCQRRNSYNDQLSPLEYERQYFDRLASV